MTRGQNDHVLLPILLARQGELLEECSRVAAQIEVVATRLLEDSPER